MGAGITHCRRPRSSDWRSGESAKFSTCENYNSDGGDLTGGKWGLWLMVVQVSFLKCDRYSKVLLSQLMISSFKGNKLYSLLFRFTEQKAGLVRGTEFLFYSKPTGNHWTLTATSQAVSSGESKFTALLYSLLPLSTPHPEKMFCHLALNENGHLGGEKKKNLCRWKGVTSNWKLEFLNGKYFEAPISGLPTMSSWLNTDIFLCSLPDGNHFWGQFSF